MFLLVSGRHVGANTDGHQRGVSIQISINLGKKFLNISRIRKIAVTRILARLLTCLPSFIFPILDLIYWTVSILILIYFEWRDTENQQLGMTMQSDSMPTQKPTFMITGSYFELSQSLSPQIRGSSSLSLQLLFTDFLPTVSTFPQCPH